MSEEKPTKPKWTSSEEFSTALQQYFGALRRLVGGNLPMEEWSESQKLIHEICFGVAHLTAGTQTSETTLAHLRGISEKWNSRTLQESRRYAVEVIARHAREWKEPEWQASAETRDRLLDNLVGALAGLDDGFHLLQHEKTDLAGYLDSFSAIPILARLVVLHGGALGLGAKQGEDEDTAIERIRLRITKDLRKPD